ncbi:probable methyltransferase-like protein 24 [Haliotis rufescens]|uniref:probable methyltransferase-like protein 24 n=1 Tax=Haliotis rufescens TaxID=6454 RepID=UPI00201E8603|nr:probable methyltransferase-like protein 24 [Haliotis rufescens]
MHPCNRVQKNMARLKIASVLIYGFACGVILLALSTLHKYYTKKDKSDYENLLLSYSQLKALAHKKGMDLKPGEADYDVHFDDPVADDDVGAVNVGEKQLPKEKPSDDSHGKGFHITEYWQASSLLKWDWEKPPEYTCRNISKAGIYAVCQDPPYTVKPPCIAYSFGVYTEWEFDETMGFMGCETHSFDPSVKWDDHIHKGVVHFHKMGIGAEDTDDYRPVPGMYVRKPQVWKMRTLPSIMKMLGHQDKVIDVLKVDVEGFEWFMLQQLIDTGLMERVRQFYVEWHLIRDFPKKANYFDLLRTYYKMKEIGFRTFSNDFKFKGYTEKRWRLQSDALYVNTKFDANLWR